MLSAMLVCMSVTAVSAQTVQAILSAVQGEVRLEQGKSSNKPRLLQRLNAGDRLVVPEGASATISFVRGGRRVALQGPVTVTMQPDDIAVSPGQASQVNDSRPPSLEAAPLAPTAQIKRGGVRQRDQLHQVFLTMDPYGFGEWPEIRWKSIRTRQFVVTVKQGDTVLFRKKVTDVFALKPPGAAEPGEYLLEVAPPDQPKLGARTPLRIYPRATGEALERMEKLAMDEFTRQPENPAPLLEILHLYASQDLMLPLLRVGHHLLDHGQRRPEVVELMQEAYNATNQLDKAEELKP